MSLAVLTMWSLGCTPYNVLAGKLYSPIGNEYSINKSKIELKLKCNKETSIQLVVENESDIEKQFTITRKMPDILIEGYKAYDGNGYIIELSADKLTVVPHGKAMFDIKVLRGASKEVLNYESWIAVKEIAKTQIRTEVCVRLLLNNGQN